MESETQLEEQGFFDKIAQNVGAIAKSGYDILNPVVAEENKSPAHKKDDQRIAMVKAPFNNAMTSLRKSSNPLAKPILGIGRFVARFIDINDLGKDENGNPKMPEPAKGFAGKAIPLDSFHNALQTAKERSKMRRF